jgi:AcrR family transcriptional regulator
MSSQRHITSEGERTRQSEQAQILDLVEPLPGELDPVLLAARQVIMEHGPRRATLAEVARQAGVSRMTVYRRFDSLDRLVSALLTVELSQLMAELPLRRTPGTTTRQYAVDLVAAMTRAIAEHPLVERVLTVDPESMVPLMVQRFGQTQRSAAEHLAPVLAGGMASRGGDGSVREGNPEVLAQTCVTAAQAFVFGAQALDSHPRGDQVWQQWPAMVDGFLRPEPGADSAAPSAPDHQETS